MTGSVCVLGLRTVYGCVTSVRSGKNADGRCAPLAARKSPTLDGKVQRDKDGKEVRYPIMLTAREKWMAQEVCAAFKQNVVGCDLLRTHDRSYICDVNGWSFVKKR